MRKFNDREILDACVEYSAARAAQIRIDTRVRRLAEEGDHRKKNKIIHTEGVKASQRVNKALTALTAILDEGALEGIRRADEALATHMAKS